VIDRPNKSIETIDKQPATAATAALRLEMMFIITFSFLFGFLVNCPPVVLIIVPHLSFFTHRLACHLLLTWLPIHHEKKKTFSSFF
jgi:hypothetical protein